MSQALRPISAAARCMERGNRSDACERGECDRVEGARLPARIGGLGLEGDSFAQETRKTPPQYVAADPRNRGTARPRAQSGHRGQGSVPRGRTRYWITHGGQLWSGVRQPTKTGPRALGQVWATPLLREWTAWIREALFGWYRADRIAAPDEDTAPWSASASASRRSRNGSRPGRA